MSREEHNYPDKREVKALSPQARFRIYSQPGDYLTSIKSLFGRHWEDQTALRKLEATICQMTGNSYAIAMPQARVGIYVAIASAVKPGNEIILSPNTIADVINMVVCAGAIPVFCDIDPLTGNLDPEQIEPLITPSTAAILVTHIYGLIAPMVRLKEIAQKHQLLLIEDAAQAFGARLNGDLAGAMGDVGIYSFGMAKNVMAFYGGLVTTPHEHIASKIRQAVECFPITSKRKMGSKVLSCLIKDIATIDLLFSLILFKIFRYAYRKNIKNITRFIETELDLTLKERFPINYSERMTSLQARLVVSKLQRVEDDFQHRLACARIYYEGLKDIPELILPPMREDGSHVYNYYAIGAPDRIALRMYMMEKGRDVALQHMKNTADLPAFDYYFRDCPNARLWAQQTIMLPNYSKYHLSEVRKNVEVIQEYFGV
ncbi:MAG: DegT/DnrJ/EryC1/StrS family aminotransferase [Phycisphaerae bacterium]|nr:DegT/DnrJ/EryC1/StrS family aminotransferase [Phycisphaerae bacterium]